MWGAMAEETRERCESISPIAKFDEGPRRCRGEKGHNGLHYASVSDGRYVNSEWDYTDHWDDDGNFRHPPKPPWERA